MSQADVNQLFDDSVAITATRDSTNVLQIGANRGRANRANIEVRVTQAFNNLTSLQVKVLQSSDGSSWDAVAVVMSDAIPLASLTIGAKIFQVVLPPTHKAYIKLNYVVVGTAPTLGKVFSELLAAPELNN